MSWAAARLTDLVTFYSAGAFIQSDVQTSANRGRITSNRRRRVRCDSHRLGCEVTNIFPLHKVDRPSQTTIQYGTTVPDEFCSYEDGEVVPPLGSEGGGGGGGGGGEVPRSGRARASRTAGRSGGAGV